MQQEQNGVILETFRHFYLLRQFLLISLFTLRSPLWYPQVQSGFILEERREC